MCLDNAVEKLATNEAKLAVDGCGGTTGKGPCLGIVVRQGGVGVLQEGNCNYSSVSDSTERNDLHRKTYPASC